MTTSEREHIEAMRREFDELDQVQKTKSSMNRSSRVVGFVEIQPMSEIREEAEIAAKDEEWQARIKIMRAAKEDHARLYGHPNIPPRMVKRVLRD